MEAGTKFKGLINGEVFEIVKITEKHNQTYYKIKHLKAIKRSNTQSGLLNTCR